MSELKKGKLGSAVDAFRAAWLDDSDGIDEAKAVHAVMTGAEIDSLHQMLFAATPVWDGDHCSKSGRDGLIAAGLAVRVCHQGEQGYTTATYPAYTIYRLVNGDDALKTGQKKARERFLALAQKTVSKRAAWLERMWPQHRKSLAVLLGVTPPNPSKS